MVQTKLKLLAFTEPWHELQLYYIRGTTQMFKLSYFWKEKLFLSESLSQPKSVRAFVTNLVGCVCMWLYINIEKQGLSSLRNWGYYLLIQILCSRTIHKRVLRQWGVISRFKPEKVTRSIITFQTLKHTWHFLSLSSAPLLLAAPVGVLVQVNRT